jgi:hypothetical protein
MCNFFFLFLSIDFVRTYTGPGSVSDWTKCALKSKKTLTGALPSASITSPALPPIPIPSHHSVRAMFLSFSSHPHGPLNAQPTNSIHSFNCRSFRRSDPSHCFFFLYLLRCRCFHLLDFLHAPAWTMAQTRLLFLKTTPPPTNTSPFSDAEAHDYRHIHRPSINYSR